MRKVKCSFTFDSFMDILKEFPELLHGHEQTFLSIRDSMVADFDKATHGADEDDWGIVHGDLWGGK